MELVRWETKSSHAGDWKMPPGRAMQTTTMTNATKRTKTERVDRCVAESTMPTRVWPKCHWSMSARRRRAVRQSRAHDCCAEAENQRQE